jgi:peptide/nickel transport system ATP-binding protein
MMIAPAALLQVRGLTAQFNRGDVASQVVKGISFDIGAGESVGFVGESGCGKSVTARALMRLAPEGSSVAWGGTVLFKGQDLLQVKEGVMQDIRGRRIAMVFQDPMSSLNPVLTVGAQIADIVRRHTGASASQARKRSVELLDLVGIRDAARRADDYPHQFSGGMRQRVLIAIAVSCQPDLLIADEPTTALDVTIQGQILDLIADLVQERGMALLLISHDLGVIAQNVAQMMVMYGGRVMESGPTATVFAGMRHPYTRGLFGARPQLGAPRGTRLSTIEGSVPELADLAPGCPFAGRCPQAGADCRTTKPTTHAFTTGHLAHCLHLETGELMP